MMKSQENWTGLCRKSQQENPVRVVSSGNEEASPGNGVVAWSSLGKNGSNEGKKKVTLLECNAPSVSK